MNCAGGIRTWTSGRAESRDLTVSGGIVKVLCTPKEVNLFGGLVSKNSEVNVEPVTKDLIEITPELLRNDYRK